MFTLSTVVVDGMSRPAINVSGRWYPFPRAIRSVRSLLENWDVTRFWIEQHAELCLQGVIAPYGTGLRQDIPFVPTGKIICINGDEKRGADFLVQAAPLFAAHGTLLDEIEGGEATWDGMLAMIIGSEIKARHSSGVLEAVCGYSAALRVTAPHPSRISDRQCVFGPGIVPGGFISGCPDLGARVALNGDAKGALARFDLAELSQSISRVSERLTLNPGDIVFASLPAERWHPAGNGAMPGDRLDMEIELLGKLSIQLGPVPAENSNLVPLVRRYR